MKRIILPNRIELVVASYGGVGTSFLLEYLSKYKKTNDPTDSDGFKHLPLPPISFNSKVRYIYVYGSPQMAAVSLFHRNYHYGQSKKMQCYNKNIVPIPKTMTLKEYASLGVDRFNFKQNFFNWYEKYLIGIPILFVRYENIFNNIEHILEFARVPIENRCKFPKKRKRLSTKESISKNTENNLNLMYGEFNNTLNKLKDLEIRKRGDRKLFSMAYLDLYYRRALKRQAGNEIRVIINKYFPNLLCALKRFKV